MCFDVSQCSNFIDLHVAFLTTCWRDCLFSVVYSCLLCQRSVDWGGFILGFVFCPIVIHVWLQLKWCELSSFVLFQNCFGYSLSSAITTLRLLVKVAQWCPTLCNPMDYTVHGFLQARILKWVAFPFSRGSSQPRDQTHVSHIAGGFFTSWATRKAPLCSYLTVIYIS